GFFGGAVHARVLEVDHVKRQGQAPAESSDYPAGLIFGNRIAQGVVPEAIAGAAGDENDQVLAFEGRVESTSSGEDGDGYQNRKRESADHLGRMSSSSMTARSGREM